MVSEEDCPLQECECAELSHQVSSFFSPPNTFFFIFCSLIFQINYDSSLFPIRTLPTSFLFFPLLPSCFWCFHSFPCGSVGRTAWLCVLSSTDTDPTSLTTPNWGRCSVFLPLFSSDLALFPLCTGWCCLAGHTFSPTQNLYTLTFKFLWQLIFCDHKIQNCFSPAVISFLKICERMETNVSSLLCSINHLGDVSLCRTTPLVTWTLPSRWLKSFWTSRRCLMLKVNEHLPEQNMHMQTHE